MTRVTSSEHVLLLLREKLQRLDRGRGSRTARADSRQKPTPAPMERLQSLAALDQVPSEEFQRTLVRALLSEEVGDAVANDPGFQTIADEVFQMINATSEGRDLIGRAAQELRGAS